MDTKDEKTPKPQAARILVIDDNQDSAITLTMLLQLKGYELTTCYSGRQGLVTAESYRPEVVILDIGMPEMDGYETCRQLRREPWGKEMVIIALTGYDQAEDKRKTQEAGFDSYLIKPVDLPTLTQLITQAQADRFQT